jgi:N-acetylglucosamine kinase-like BadF-type ATPase
MQLFEEDTYAAVYATTPRVKSNCFYLGTVLTVYYFDGKELSKVQSLGYIVMDDCSGNVFGKS